MDQLKIQTNHGKVQGIEENSLRIWRGIPYAKTPIGKLRYRAPQMMTDWNGVYDCSRFRAAPMQKKIGIINCSNQRIAYF